jgi:hypothetical protein
MGRTRVICSFPGCHQNAALKIAARWREGRFAELKTFGFACPLHQELVSAIASQRQDVRRPTMAEREQRVETYPLARLTDCPHHP